jgi:hypothetical protein
VEHLAGRVVDISWGESGNESTALTFEAMRAAEDCGHIVVLD